MTRHDPLSMLVIGLACGLAFGLLGLVAADAALHWLGW